MESESESESETEMSCFERQKFAMILACSSQSGDADALRRALAAGGDPDQILCEYRAKVVAAGSWAAYERAHRARLTKTFAPKFPHIRAEIVPTIVAFAFHTGWY